MDCRDSNTTKRGLVGTQSRALLQTIVEILHYNKRAQPHLSVMRHESVRRQIYDNFHCKTEPIKQKLVCFTHMSNYPHTLKHTHPVSHCTKCICMRAFELRRTVLVFELLKPNSTRMFFGIQHVNTSVAPRGFCCKSQKMKVKTSPLGTALCFITLTGYQTACGH